MEVMETEHDIRLKLIIQKLEPIQIIFFPIPLLLPLKNALCVFCLKLLNLSS